MHRYHFCFSIDNDINDPFPTCNVFNTCNAWMIQMIQIKPTKNKSELTEKQLKNKHTNMILVCLMKKIILSKSIAYKIIKYKK